MNTDGDPIRLDLRDCKWYFYDETWTDRYGPFETEQEARDEFLIYCVASELLTNHKSFPEDDDGIRQWWRDQGGTFHGPNIEHGKITEAELFVAMRRAFRAYNELDQRCQRFARRLLDANLQRPKGQGGMPEFKKDISALIDGSCFGEGHGGVRPPPKTWADCQAQAEKQVEADPTFTYADGVTKGEATYHVACEIACKYGIPTPGPAEYVKPADREAAAVQAILPPGMTDPTAIKAHQEHVQDEIKRLQDENRERLEAQLAQEYLYHRKQAFHHIFMRSDGTQVIVDRDEIKAADLLDELEAAIRRIEP